MSAGDASLLQAIALASVLAWASGMRLYLVILAAGIASRYGWLDLPEGLRILSHTYVLVAAGLLVAVEFLADKVPGLDSAWDAIHTFIRIPAGALLAAGAAAWWLARGPLPSTPGVGGSEGGAGVVVVPGGDELPEVTRIKGDPVLTIDRMAAGRSERLRDGADVHAGDRLQLQYGAAEREQGAIVSIDGRGTATLHFPDDVTASPRLASGGLVALDHSYELDDAPQFERFFFVTVPRGRELSVAAVMAAAEALADAPAAMQQPLKLPAGYEQVAITLHKSR